MSECMPVECYKVEEREAGRDVTAPAGASGNPEPHSFGWRDAMDIIVKWRQLSEPNDQVHPPSCSGPMHNAAETCFSSSAARSQIVHGDGISQMRFLDGLQRSVNSQSAGKRY